MGSLAASTAIIDSFIMFGLHKYPYIHFLLINFYLILCARLAWSKYSIPDIKFEAFKPKGFRVSIPNEPGIRLFAFHGKLNSIPKDYEPGELSKDVTEATNGFWVFDDPELELQIGEYVGYWVYVQHDYLGYHKKSQRWDVEELISEVPLQCQESETLLNGKPACSGSLIFHDSFSGIDETKWMIEKYIPISGPNYEFNYYTPECVSVDNQQLKIMPQSKEIEADLRGTLDLQDGCTSSKLEECLYKHQAAFYLPPVKSGKIKSKFCFKYGKVEITAKLPCGDWIFPEISLVPVEKRGVNNKIYIAYSRGNKHLLSDGNDIGNNLLLSGPCKNPVEPEKSEFFKSVVNKRPYCEEFHTYTIIWKPDEVLSFVDGESMARIDVRNSFAVNEIFDDEYCLNLGVSIGGINDFPNDCKSGNVRKPWRNKDRKQIKDFFNARNQWLPTWNNDTSAMLIESVRVYAL